MKCNSFCQDVAAFANNHKILCVLTLGLAVVGYSIGNLAGRAVTWICECVGTTKKTNEVALSTLDSTEDSDGDNSINSMSFSDRISSVGEGTLNEANRLLRDEIISTPTYQPSPAAANLNYGIYNGGPFPKEFMDPHTHQHRIFENVYLGDLRGYLSLDPQFIQEHPISDRPEDILSLDEMTPQLRADAEQHLNRQIDRTGCSELGIKYVLSATQFQPSDRVPPDDWSRFNPDLAGLGIERMQVAVDDNGFAWEGIKPHFQDAFEFIDKARMENRPCLVHCVKGASRSVTLLTAYLMNRCGVTRNQAFNFIQTKRTVADLKSDMAAGLEQYEIELRSARVPIWSTMRECLG